MLWTVRSFRDRFRLRLNNDHQVFRTYDVDRRQWHVLPEGCAGSLTATLTTDLGGKRIKLSSHMGYSQCVILVNSRNNRVTGFIRVTEEGAIRVSDSPTFVFAWPLPDYWQEKVTAIVGIDGAFTANISDCVGNDEDIIRLKDGHKTIFVPARYSKPTDAYDYTAPLVFSTPSELSFADESEGAAGCSQGLDNAPPLQSKDEVKKEEESSSDDD